jgi:non-ribosomal peptide synthetase-like protein
VVFATTRARGGLIEVRSIEVGDRTFLGNGAILRAGTRVGNGSLVGVLSSPPLSSADGTSWFGLPPLEFPRVPERLDPARTTTPPRRLVLARGAAELVRIFLPATISVVLGALVFSTLEGLGSSLGGVGLVVGAPFVVLAASLCAVGVTVGAKWLLMGRYKPGKHPFWSFFVWRDEIVNTCHEKLAGAWLLTSALGTSLVPAYLRAMGSRVGRGVWFESLNVTEYDLVDLGDGCVVNRGACVETHLFHDRLLNMGPAVLGSGSTLGPTSAVLPDTVLGRGCTVGARSVVLRGESLPPNTAWHGAPVQCR